MQSQNLSERVPVLPDSDLVKHFSTLLADCTSLRNAQSALDDASRFEHLAKKDRAALILFLQIKDKAKLVSETAPVWQALYDEDPSHEIIVRDLIRSHAKLGRKDEAVRLVEHHYGVEIENRSAQLKRAALLESIGQTEESYQAYERLIDAEPSDHRARLHYSKRLAKVGRFLDALSIVAPVAETAKRDPKNAELIEDWQNRVDCLRRHIPERDLNGVDCRYVALECLLRTYRDRNPRPIGEDLKISLLTGGLGAGGAERQLSRLARIIKSEYGNRHEVKVVVKTLLLTSAKPNDFFLDDLVSEDIAVDEIEAMKPIHAGRQVELDEDREILFSMLPPQVHYGVTRLAPHFRENNFDVVSIWQDGATLYGALAALFADVPNIHLVFRGLPPNLRPERATMEYEVIFKEMAQMRGVRLVCNSRLVAAEYARWLSLPDEKVEILYNAVTAHRTTPTISDQQKWSRFEEQTRDAETTLGGVFRFEPLKQPTLWIRFAARYAELYPNSRFILVGDGRLRELLEEQIEALGLADRFLLVGRSRSVDFWYEKMDVKLLLSRFEGLPNVLIEAQAAGLPVIATPTGGSSECFIEGETGYILDDVVKPDLTEGCKKAHELAMRFRNDPSVRMRGSAFARERFSDQQSLRAFFELCRI